MKLKIRFILLPSNFQQFVPRCFISPNHRYTYSMRIKLLNKTNVPLNFWFREIQLWDSVDTVLRGESMLILYYGEICDTGEVESMFDLITLLLDLVSTTLNFYIILYNLYIYRVGTKKWPAWIFMKFYH